MESDRGSDSEYHTPMKQRSRDTLAKAVNAKQNEPLFKKVFWHRSKDSHITMPVRQLLDITLEVFTNSTDPESQISKVDSCMSLLFLVGTHCTTTDLATELTIISRKLPQEHLRLFLSSLKPQPLRANVTQ